MHKLHQIGAEITVVKKTHVVLKVSGEVDMSNVQCLRSAIEDVVHGCSPGLVIDLTATDFIDSTGIAALIAAQRVLEKDGCLLLIVTSNPYIKRTLGLIDIESLPGVSLCKNVAAATRMLGAQQG